MVGMMRGASAESLARLTGTLDGLLSGGGAGEGLGKDLLNAATVLRGQVALRRSATDPTAPAEAKSGLLRGVFSGHVGVGALGILGEAGGLRWARGADLVAALEHLGVVAVVRAADAAGEGDRLEAELFSFERTITQSPDLRSALSDPGRSVTDKQGLVASLLAGKAADATRRLVAEAVASDTILPTLQRYAKVAAEVRNRQVATVRVARPLSAEQTQRLANALGENGSTVHLNVIVDADVVGGLRVEMGDHVIDGTVASRVDDARRRIAG
ncbi:MAG: F0F1 ATP synthase subunit delta [Marmoricola sp.]